MLSNNLNILIDVNHRLIQCNNRFYKFFILFHYKSQNVYKNAVFVYYYIMKLYKDSMFVFDFLLYYMRQLLFITFPLFLLFSCKTNEDLLLDDSFYFYNKSQVVMIDTLSVNMQTYRLDSVFTSGTNRILLGSLYDSVFGSVSSNSYIEFNITNNTILTDEDVYDSIQLLLQYDGYYDGDTTQSQSIKVHRLLEEIKTSRSSGKYVSNDDFNVDNEILGEITFYPNPHGNNEYISLDSEYGNDIFNYVKRYPDSVYNYAYLLKEFHGLKIESDSNSNSSVVGFKAYDDELTEQYEVPVSTVIRIYYHSSEEKLEKMWFDLGVFDVASQFNRIYNSNNTGNLITIQPKEIINSENTADITCIQSCTGIITKIDIPNIKDLTEYYGQGKILGAYIKIYPTQNLYNEDISLPDTLFAYETTNSLKIGDRLADFSGNYTNIALLQLNNEFPDKTCYALDITGFLTNNFETTENTTNAIFLTGGEPNDSKSVSRVLLGNQNQEKVEVILYYLKLK